MPPNSAVYSRGAPHTLATMNRFLLSAALATTFVLAGCESTSFSDRLRERFAAVQPQARAFEGDPRTVYFAAQQAFKRLDYRLLRSDVSSLTVEAASRIDTSVAFRDSRQMLAQLEIKQVGPAESEVRLLLTEQREGEGPGGANQLALKEHGFYEIYFAVLQQVLREQVKADTTRKE